MLSQRSLRRRLQASWNVESTARHRRRRGHPLQLKEPLVVTASVPPDPGSRGRESGIAPVQRLSHLKPFPHRCFLSGGTLSSPSPPQSFHQKPCGDGERAKQQVEATTGSCSQNPARRRPGGNSRSSSDPGTTVEFGVPPGD